MGPCHFPQFRLPAQILRLVSTYWFALNDTEPETNFYKVISTCLWKDEKRRLEGVTGLRLHTSRPFATVVLMYLPGHHLFKCIALSLNNCTSIK